MQQRRGRTFRERLEIELPLWQRDGLIDEEQGRRILSRYPEQPPSDDRAFRLNRLTAFIATTGALVFGAGVVLFFATNWDVIPAWLKVALVYTAVAAAYTAGYLLRFRTEIMPRVGEALILLGALLFQAGIFLMAQIYNLPVDSPSILGFGALGILPLAYATGLRSALTVGLLDALAWIGWEIISTYQDEPAAAVALPVFLLAGVVLFALGNLHRRDRGGSAFHEVYELLGLLTALTAAYVLSFGDLWDEIDDDLADLSAPVWFSGVLALGALAAVSLAWRPGRGSDRAAVGQAAVALVVTALAAAAVLAPEGARAYPAAFNLLFFGLALLACVLGYLRGAARFINAGIPALAVGLVTRYVDVFGGLLPASAAYLTGGALLLAVAVLLERVRRRLLAAAEPEGEGGE